MNKKKEYFLQASFEIDQSNLHLLYIYKLQTIHNLNPKKMNK